MPAGIYVNRNYRIRIYSARVEKGVPELVQRTIARIDSMAKSRAPYVTGTLRRSIHSGMTGKTTGWVGSRNVPYARIQDKGGRTSPHIIRPRNKKALYWPGAAHPVKVVHHPGSIIHGNGYLTSSFEDGMRDFNAALTKLLTP